jgi:hypothetical protein
MHMRDYTIHLGVNYGIYVSQMVCEEHTCCTAFLTHYYYAQIYLPYETIDIHYRPDLTFQFLKIDIKLTPSPL